jgi:S-adenosylmethionine synthetase
MGRVACETLVTTGLAFVAGEITTHAYVDVPNLVRSVLKDIGYTKSEYGIDHQTCSVISAIDPQSPDIAMGVDTGGAGDQGLSRTPATRQLPRRSSTWPTGSPRGLLKPARRGSWAIFVPTARAR